MIKLSDTIFDDNSEPGRNQSRYAIWRYDLAVWPYGCYTSVGNTMRLRIS